MYFLYFVFTILFLLIFIIIKSVVLNFAFKFLLKNKIEIKLLALPITLSLILFVLLITIATFILSQFNISIYSLFVCILLKLTYSFKTLGYVFLSYIIAIILFLLIEGFILKLITIPSTKNEKEYLTYGQGLVISFFSFAIFFFFIILLIFIGESLGIFLLNNKYL